MHSLLIFVVLSSIQLACTRTILPRVIQSDLDQLQSSISNQSCEFYNVLEKLSPCGSQGYVQKFIYKYCMTYLNNQKSFKNQAWQNSVRVCLQQKMLSYLQENPHATCSQIKTAGFDSHTDCYLQPNRDQPDLTFCHLPSQDIAKVIWIAKGTIFEPAVWSQLAQLIKNCSLQILQG